MLFVCNTLLIKMKKTVFTAILVCACIVSGEAQTKKRTEDASWKSAVNDPVAKNLARPSKVQYDWQEMERAMFIQLDPATIQEGEYDTGTTKMEDIRFEKLDVNEWCKAAKSFGAKEIVFMLAHSGGFCMWPSKTTDYHIGNTAYKGGDGDVVKEFAKACRKTGLKAGFYFWMPRPLAAGGDTNTVSYSQLDKVQTWADADKVFKTRFHEIMDRLGSDLVTEIWIDQPIRASLGKEIADRAPKAVVAAVGCVDPYPTIRWPGNEQGQVSDPCWSTLKKSSIAKKPATQFEADNNQTQAADDPDGDYWAPHEADTPLHDHFWHFRPDALNHRKTLDELMDCYLKSAGRNSFLILNCAPMADGSIHPDDMKRYQEFGEEIERRFGHPVARVEKVSGNEVLLKLDKPCRIVYTDLWEEYQYGQRIRAYEIEGRDATTGNWIKIAEGTSVGRRKIDPITIATEVDQLKVTIRSSVGTPLIRKFQVHVK